MQGGGDAAVVGEMGRDGWGICRCIFKGSYTYWNVREAAALDAGDRGGGPTHGI